MKELDLSKIFSSMKENDISELVIKEGSKIYEVRRGGIKQNIVASSGQQIVHSMPAISQAPANISQTGHQISTPSISTEKAEIKHTAGEAKKSSNLYEVKSPLVGTFYAAPKPEAPNFVEIGTKVKKGQTLCIVEAMKNFNEIECDVDGVIEEILVKNGDLVEFGKILFKVKLG